MLLLLVAFPHCGLGSKLHPLTRNSPSGHLGTLTPPLTVNQQTPSVRQSSVSQTYLGYGRSFGAGNVSCFFSSCSLCSHSLTRPLTDSKLTVSSSCFVSLAGYFFLLGVLCSCLGLFGAPLPTLHHHYLPPRPPCHQFSRAEVAAAAAAAEDLPPALCAS